MDSKENSNFFKNLSQDCLVHISSFFSGKELKQILLVEKYLNIFFDDNADIIFNQLIENKYQFYEYKNSYLFKKSNKGISMNKQKTIKNKLAILTNFKII